jgi:transposase InsO family protein
MCQDCQWCQRGKIHKQPAAPLHAIPVPALKFSHVHVGLVGPLPASSDGHVYLLTIIDRSTRWMEAVPLCNMEASTCTDALITNWVANFGMQATVTTDKGAQFTSALWTAACTSLGIKHVLTTAYHPQSNRMVERVHRCPTCSLSGPDMALPSSLGADVPACSTKRGFGRLISRAGHWDTTHTSWPAAAHTRSSMCRRAAATQAASILCRNHQHTARSPSPGGTCLCACWRSAETSSGPICRPISGGLQGGQDIHHPGEPEAGGHLCGPLEGPHRPQPGVPCRGRFLWPPYQEVSRYFNPACAFMKPQTGGAP